MLSERWGGFLKRVKKPAMQGLSVRPTEMGRVGEFKGDAKDEAVRGAVNSGRKFLRVGAFIVIFFRGF
jgi:hypothetical protein